MFDLYKIIKPFLFLLNPEFAHNCIIKYLKLRSYFFKEVVDDKKLKTSLAGINLSNPLGIAAGFDKDGEAIIGINNLGFGFIEVGSVTPRPQTGNPKPRLFRLKEDKAVINRMGFNNAGQISVLGHIRKVRDKPIVIGINLGANKDTKHFLDDYLNGFETFIDAVDFIVINISSPNTPGLTDLQEEIHNQFKDWVSKRRGNRLNKEIINKEGIFEAKIFSGVKACEIGLADSIGELKQVLRERIDEKVVFKEISGRKKLGQRLGLSSSRYYKVIDYIEEKIAFSRYGL